MSSSVIQRTRTWVTLLILGVTFFVSGSLYAKSAAIPGVEKSSDEIRSEDILKKQLDILRKQKFFGKGKYIVRRYEKLKERGENAFNAGRYEEASLVYYTIIENPEFADIVETEEIEFHLIQSLYQANEYYAALDYIEQALSRGARSSHFIEIFRILVDSLNRVRDWNRINPIMQMLQKQQSSFPAIIREEANYLFGRLAFFQSDLGQTKIIFGSITPSSRFYSRAVYHLGVVAAKEGDLPLASKYFQKAYAASKKSADFEISESGQSDKQIASEKKLFQDLCILALARVEYTQGKEGPFNKVASRSPYYSIAIFENGWLAFRQKNYEEALRIAQDFMVRFPSNGLYPEAILLSGNSNMEAGRLETAGKEFRRFIDSYEPLLPILKYISQNRDPSQAVRDFNSQDQLKKHPELYAWAFEGPNLENIRRALQTVTVGEKGVESDQAIWQSISDLLGEQQKIRFPGKSRISQDPKLLKSQRGTSKKDVQLHELEMMETELKQRMSALEASKKASLDKGRKQALDKAIETEHQRLAALQAKLKVLRGKVLAEKAANAPKRSKEEALAIKEFEDLAAMEANILPLIKKGLESKRGAFQYVSAKIVQRRIGLLMEQLSYWVRKAYLGQIEIAFIRREKTKGEEQQAARRELVTLINAFLKKYPGAPEVPDQWFRLAELAYEESKQRFFAAQAAFDQQYELYRKGTLKTEPREPKADYTESIQICKRLLKEFPNFPSKDRVLYVLGYYYDEQELKQESLDTFKQLVDEFPKSEFALEGYMRLAENYFDLRKFKKAIETYAILLTHRESVFYEIALYKTAWSYYRLGDYKNAVTYFTKVVVLGRPEANAKLTGLEAERMKRLQDLHNEALTYLALSFSEEGGPRGVVAYFQQAGLSQYTIDVLRRLSDIYYQTLRYQEAIEATRIFLETSPYVSDGPTYQARIVESYEKMGDTQAAFKERQRLADNFGPRSQWTEKNKTNAAAIKEARTLVEESLIYSATLYHEKAQKASEGKSPLPAEAKESYTLALEAYKKYIWDFPDSPKAYEMRFNFAEALYAMQNYEEAGFQYDKVARMNLKDGKFLKEAAFASVLSYEKLLKQSGVDFESEVSKMKTPKIPEGGQATAPKVTKKREFDRNERLLSQSYDNYVTWLPKGEKVPEISFKAALLSYHVGDFPDAVRRFTEFYQRFPTNHLTPSALNYILVAYVNNQDWPHAEEWARRILNDQTQAKNFERKDLEKLLGVAMMYEAENLRKGGNLQAASSKYMDINKEFKDNPLAARGLYNAAAIYEKEGNHPQSVATLEKLVENYPHSEFAANSLFHVAKSYERQMKFEQAGIAYERLANQYPTSEYASDALFNAGLFMESLGQYDRAAKNYLEYSRRFPNKQDAGEVHFSAAKSYELAGKSEQATQLYLEQVAKFNPPIDRELECLARAADNNDKMGRGEAARKEYGRVVTLYEKNSKKVGEQGRYYAGKARFLQAEEAYERYSAVKLHLPAKQMAKDLEEKANRLERLNREYVEVVAIGHPEWATAALYKIGKSYQEFSEALYAAPKPKGMNERDLEMYQKKLEEQAFPIEDKAVGAYEKGLQKAQELGAYGVWTEKILTQLQTYRPQRYPPLREHLPKMRMEGSYYEGKFIEVQ